MGTNTRRRARHKTAPAAAPAAASLSCEVCHTQGDEKTLRNWGTESLPYWMCTTTAECDERAWGAHREADPEPAPEPEATAAEAKPETEDATTEETAEVTP
jgi:hypothetical protein